MEQESQKFLPVSKMTETWKCANLGESRVVRRCWVKLSVPVRPTYLDNNRARACCA